jgi:hypothetical protein
MGVRVILTTKFHAEMAGGGIEYLWGVSKWWYRSKPLKLKSKKASFLQLVRGCLDPKLITKEKVRSFSKKGKILHLCLHVNKIKIKAKKQGRSALAASS